jgi:SulP family sulfate permease
LASYLLSDRQSEDSPAFLYHHRSRPSLADAFAPEYQDSVDNLSRNSEAILEVSEPSSPEQATADGPSALTNLLKKSPPQSVDNNPVRPIDDREADSNAGEDDSGDEDTSSHRPSIDRPAATERTPLLRQTTSGGGHSVDLEGQKDGAPKGWLDGIAERAHKMEHQAAHTFAVAVNPRRWNGRAIWQNAVVTPAATLPAVAVGLLLNILDALSYGMMVLQMHVHRLTKLIH